MVMNELGANFYPCFTHTEGVPLTLMEWINRHAWILTGNVSIFLRAALTRVNIPEFENTLRNLIKAIVCLAVF